MIDSLKKKKITKAKSLCVCALPVITVPRDDVSW